MDLQLWNTLAIDHKLNDKWSFIFEPAWRIREDVSEFFYFESRQGLSYKFNKHLDLGGQWLLVDSKNSKNEWVDTHSMELQGILKCEWAGFKFSDRNRFEDKKVGANGRWFYRNLVKVAKPIKNFPFGLTPYISEEIFWDFQAEEYFQRLQYQKQ